MKIIRSFGGITEQKILEFLSVGYLFTTMVLAAIVFWINQDSQALNNFSEVIRININNQHFAVASAIGATLSLIPLLPFHIGTIWKQQFYMAGSYPLVAYTIPIGWYALHTSGTGIGVLIYLLFELSFFIISRAVWRREIKSDVTPHTIHPSPTN